MEASRASGSALPLHMCTHLCVSALSEATTLHSFPTMSPHVLFKDQLGPISLG